MAFRPITSCFSVEWDFKRSTVFKHLGCNYMYFHAKYIFVLIFVYIMTKSMYVYVFLSEYCKLNPLNHKISSVIVIISARKCAYSK